MNDYLIIITIIGLAAFGMAWMPAFTERTHISYSIIYVVAGVLIYIVMDSLPFPNPLWQEEHTIHITELIVIISLMSTGLRIDQPFSFKAWAIPFRLVTITMILSIGAVAWGAYQFLSLDVASALLLGAVLAPTDPVLASDVQVGPPLQKERDNVRFSLTAEAGLNDGMAFPFTWLAIGVALYMNHENGSIDWHQWILKDLIFKLFAGVGCGFLLGRALAYLVFALPSQKKIVKIRDGFVAISITLFVYGITELLGGYGFVAVFICAVTMRNYEMNHAYHKKLHSFTDQIERTLIAIVLLLFGGSLVNGILANISWPIVFFSIASILIIRPVCAFVALIKTGLHWKEKLVISFFGIKGIGSFFYLSFALKQTEFSAGPDLWTIVALTVLFSLFLHGITATGIMKKVNRQFTRFEGE